MRLFDLPASAGLPADDVGPFVTAEEELDAHLSVIALRVQHLHALIEEGVVDQLPGQRKEPGPAAVERGRGIEQRTAEVHRRSELTEKAGHRTPLARLKERFGLGPVAVDALLAAVAPERNPSFRTAYAALWPESNLQPEVFFYTRLLADGKRSEREVRHAMDPDGPLVQGRLLELSSAGHWLPAAPLLYRRVRVPERVLSFLEGEEEPPPTLLEGARWCPRPRPAETLLLDLAFREQVSRSLRMTDVVPVLYGLNGVGKKTIVETVAAEVGRSMLAIDLSALSFDAEAARGRLHELAREARLQNAVLVLEHAEVADDERHAGLARELARLIERLDLPTALTATREPKWLEPMGVRHILFRTEVPPAQRQCELWMRLLPTSLRLDPGLTVESIVHRYSLVPGAIEEACEELGRLDVVFSRHGIVGPTDLATAIRARLVHRLGALATSVTTQFTWDDLVLPPDVINRLLEFLSYARQREHVLEDHGFGKKLAYGRGLSALFSGPPGTGKTMVSSLLAAELGLELYRIDLSQVVNKYIGETEKNLGQIFDEASHGQVVLLFDEADSLFAKRTEVKSSHDRYANLEVNYLLQRMETFEGVMILTTNAETAIDPAFRRRIRFRIRFPAPSEAQRTDLWRSMVPVEAPLGEDVDFRALAKRYPLAGGSIKNAVVRAAVAAAEDGTAIQQTHLMRAAALEYEEMGFLSERAEE